MNYVLGIFFDTEKKAIAHITEWRNKYGDRREWYLLKNSKGYLVVSGDALKKVGVLPHRKQGKKLSTSGILERRRLAI